MLRLFAYGIAGAVVFLAVAGSPLGIAAAEPKLRVLVVTGGHGFDEKGFAAMWKSFGEFEVRRARHKKTAEAFSRANLEACDVVALYDMAQKSTEEERAAFLDFVKRGGGVVALHHCIASHQTWPEYERIIGGKYLLKPETRDGREVPGSTYQHDVTLPVHVADPDHPITRGISDFEIRDEAYKGYLVNPKVHVLLTTDHPKSTRKIAWTRQEGKARIAFIALGHDNHAFADANYRKLVEQAIVWSAGRKAP